MQGHAACPDHLASAVSDASSRAISPRPLATPLSVLSLGLRGGCECGPPKFTHGSPRRLATMLPLAHRGQRDGTSWRRARRPPTPLYRRSRDVLHVPPPEPPGRHRSTADNPGCVGFERTARRARTENPPRNCAGGFRRTPSAVAQRRERWSGGRDSGDWKVLESTRSPSADTWPSPVRSTPRTSREASDGEYDRGRTAPRER